MRVGNRNIGFSKVHNYTVEKVKKAMEFVNSSNRFTTAQEWLDMYNELKGTTHTLSGCKRCALTKYVSGVKSYAHNGYLVLLAEGHSVDEFKDEPEVAEETETAEEPQEEVIENEEKRIVKTTKPKKTAKKTAKKTTKKTTRKKTSKK